MRAEARAALRGFRSQCQPAQSTQSAAAAIQSLVKSHARPEAAAVATIETGSATLPLDDRAALTWRRGTMPYTASDDITRGCRGVPMAAAVRGQPQPHRRAGGRRGPRRSTAISACGKNARSVACQREPVCDRLSRGAAPAPPRAARATALPEPPGPRPPRATLLSAGGTEHRCLAPTPAPSAATPPRGPPPRRRAGRPPPPRRRRRCRGPPTRPPRRAGRAAS